MVLYLKEKPIGFKGFQFPKDFLKSDINPKEIINFEESLRM